MEMSRGFILVTFKHCHLYILFRTIYQDVAEQWTRKKLETTSFPEMFHML